jgi:hypothetical protein
MPETYNKIYKSMADLEAADIRSIYDKFNSPFAEFDQYANHSEKLRHHFM